MLLLLHIVAAVLSLLFIGISVLMPDKLRLKLSYCLVGLTLISGTVLTFSRLSHLASICVTGLVYIGVATIGLVVARRRLIVEAQNF